MGERVPISCDATLRLIVVIHADAMRPAALAGAFAIAALAGCGPTLFDAQHVPAHVPVCTSGAEPIACAGAASCVAEDDRHCGPACADCLGDVVQHGTRFCDVSGAALAQHACATACAPGFVNDPNGPGCVCGAGEVACGDAGACITETVTACGAGCQTCGAPPGATPVCSSHACDYVCPAGKVHCTNPNTDQADCCTPPCVAGLVLCGSTCLPESATQCGSGCVDCATAPVTLPANGVPACIGPASQGACSFACKPGFLKVDGGCAQVASGAATVALGRAHTCVVTTTGRVMCWGSNGSGQLGSGDVVSRFAPAPVALAGGALAAAVTAGESHTCALTTAGAVQCWGSNAAGQLGLPLTSGSSAVPVVVPGLAAAKAVAAGAGHTCAIATNGDVLCWGDNRKGQLGTTASAPNPTPARVNLQGAAALLATQVDHTCIAKAADGHVLCWGSNVFGQTGQSASATPSAPNAVSGLAATALSPGGSHTCAVGTVANGAASGVYCWGDRSAGQLGDGLASPATSVPTLASQLTPTATPRLVLAGRAHTCAAAAGDVSAQCAGANLALQAGDATPAAAVLAAVKVPLAGPVDALYGGGDRGCAVVAGALWCWGANDHGQLGVAAPAESAVPVTPQPF